MTTFTKTCPCGDTFTYEAERNKRKYCDECKRELKRKNNLVQYQAKRARDGYKRHPGDYKTPNGYTPFVVVSHNNIDGFNRGAAFKGVELKYMIQEGWVEGLVVKNKGKMFEIRKCRMVEVKG